MLPDFFYLILFFFVSGGASSMCCPLNFGSMHHDSRSLLKTLWIIHPSGSSSLNAPDPMFFEILNGPYLLLSSFFEGRFKWIFLFSSHTLSPTFNPWEFLLFLSNCFFMFFCASSIALVTCSQLFCSPIRKSSTLGISIWMSYTSLPVWKQHPRGETTSKPYKPAFHDGHLSCNMSHGSAATLQIFHLLRRRYSYSTQSSMTELLLSVSQHWNLHSGQ